MSQNRRPVAGSTGRFLWIAAAAVLLLLISASFLMSSKARQDAEEEAQLSAEVSVTGLSADLSPELVESDILGSAYRDLLTMVQADVMADDRVIRVRIWKPDGDLIFSTAPRDEIETFVAVDNTQIRQAADGQTVSVVAEATVAPLAGLEGSDEELFVTYAPLRFASETSAPAVVEIDQEYSAVREASDRIWRPVQIGLLIALGGLAVLFGVSRRRGRSTASTRFGPKPARVSRDERSLRDAEDRAIAAERVAGEAEARLADSQRRLEELTKAEIPPALRARLEELELRLRSEQAEREQFVGEAKRLRSALSEREAELALVRDKTVSTEAEKVRSIDAVQRAEQQTADAERRAGAAGSLAAEADGRAAKAEAKVVELETALRDADRRLTAAVAEAQRTAEQGSRDEESRAVTDLRAARLEIDDLQLRLAEGEAALKASLAKQAESDGAAAELVRIRGEADGVRAELDEARLEIQRTMLELEARSDELETSRSELETSRSELETSRTELETSRSELETSRSELETSRSELETSRSELETAGAELEAARGERDREAGELQRAREELAQMEAEVQRLMAEPPPAPLEAAERDDATSPRMEAARLVSGLEARLAEVESERRNEIAELQRAQESLANTQFELMDATRRLKASEERIRQLEAEEAARSPDPIAPATDDDLDVPASPTPSWEPSRHEPSAESEEPFEDEEPEVDSPEELSEEALSLRERLARAAAARHRTVQPPN